MKKLLIASALCASMSAQAAPQTPKQIHESCSVLSSAVTTFVRDWHNKKPLHQVNADLLVVTDDAQAARLLMGVANTTYEHMENTLGDKMEIGARLPDAIYKLCFDKRSKAR
jgi:hypothetical protein